MWEWFQAKAQSKHAQFWLVAVSFGETVCVPLVSEMLLMPILAARAGRWKHYAFITSVASVVGAVVGYLLGLYVFEPVVQPLINLYGLTEQFAHVGELYAQSTFWSVFTGAFTPIPFKIFVLAGGFFSVPFIPFILAAIVGRFLRFYLMAWIAHTFGPKVAEKCIDHFNYITFIVVVLIAIALAVYFDVPEYFF